MVNSYLIKRLLYISLPLIISFIVVLHNVSEEENTAGSDSADVLNTQLPASFIDDDFVIKSGSNYIEINGCYEDIETDEKIINFYPITENHTYEVYEYENFIISVSPNSDNRSKILSVNLTSDKIATSRGIRVGDSISNVFEKYGEPDSSYSLSFNYYHESKFITFYFNDNEVVIGIKFELI